MSYTNGLDNPELFFQTKLYTGNGGTNALTLDGSENLSPNFVWIKNRNGTQDHHLFDSVRGTLKRLESNSTAQEETRANSITSYNSDGFTLGDYANTNTNNDTYVAWNWKAGTSFTNDASSTGIGTIDSTGSFNNTSGISIVSYTGTGSTGTLKHGMNVAPKMIFVKRRDSSANWFVGHDSLGWTKYLYLDLTEAVETNSGAWNNTSPTSSVFSLGTFGNVNASSGTYVAYCFADVKGYSKFGSYTGNGSATDGTFVYTGFKPAFVMMKCTNASPKCWIMVDNKRDTFNVMNKKINANDPDAEYSSQTACDFLSNGFKLRDNSTNAFSTNNSGGSYVYMAFAEAPFVTSTGIPTTAR